MRQNSFYFVLGKLMSSPIQDLRQQAYVIATVRHEVGNTFEPVTEKGSSSYLKKKPYYPYIGRGYVQLTWESNYKKFGDLLGVDLISNPDLACDPEIAWKILEIGTIRGLFTGKKLSDYFNDERCEWENARRIINAMDRAELIGSYARQYHKHLSSLMEV